MVSVADELDFYAVEVFVVFDSEARKREILDKIPFGTLMEGKIGGVGVGGEGVEGYRAGRAVECLWCNLEDTVLVSFRDA